MTDSKRIADSTPRVTPSRIWMCGWLALTVIFALLFVSQSMSVGNPDLNLAMNFIFLAVFVLTLRFWTGALVFAFCQAELLFGDFRSADPAIYPDGWILTGLSFLLIVVISTFRTLQERDSAAAYRLLRSWLPAGNQNSATKEEAVESPVDQATAEAGRLVRQLLRAGVLLLACGIAAWLILDLFPTRRTVTGLNTISTYRLRPAGHRMIVVGLTIFTVFLIAWTLINELTWRRITRGQSRVYLSSVMLKTLLPDLRMVIRKRVKLRRRRRSKTKLATPTESED
ncbi:MAG: hypothetical protein NXI04_20345 [Planctomycetaceae bacterium]|nr:hypothetical protein [Planctomycetaceae bacterium]